MLSIEPDLQLDLMTLRYDLTQNQESALNSLSHPGTPEILFASPLADGHPGSVQVTCYHPKGLISLRVVSPTFE